MKPAKLRTMAMAAGAVAVTIAATAVVASIVSSPADPVSQDDADRLLSQTATPTPDTPTPAASTTTGTGATTSTGAGTTTSTGAGTTTSPRTSGTGSGSGDTVAHVTPGTVTIHCDGSLATLVSWSPNPGYVSRDTVRGPASQVSVKFESDIYDHYLVSATCSDGTATVQAVELEA